MDARPTATVIGRENDVASFRPWLSVFGTCGALLLTSLALVIWTRRASGALLAAPAAATILPGAIALSVLAVASSRFVGLGDRERESEPSWPMAAWPCVALVVSAAGLHLRGAALLTVIALWGPVAVAVAAVGIDAWRTRYHRLIRAAGTNAGRHRALMRIDEPQCTPPHHDALAEAPPESALDDDDVLQHMTRRRQADGSDVLSGYLRTTFAAGQRSGSAHLAFCPPFEHSPRFEFAQIGGPAARIKLGQLLPYGARLELKLGDSYDEPVVMAIEFKATHRSAGDDGER